MEEFSSEKGIFIHCANFDLKFMIQCLQAVNDISPDTKVISVACDDRVGGYRMCLADSEAKNLLSRRYLTVTDQKICVYPLATCLLVHGIDVNAETERDFIEIIQEKFGKVLHLEKVTDEVDGKSSKSHLVLLDIPEIESLNVFLNNGYPRMSVAVPSMCKRFRVSFWCRRCKEQGHSHQDCFDRSGKASGRRRQSGLPEQPTENKIEMHSSFSSENPAIKKSSFLEPTASFANKLGKEVVMRTGIIPENESIRHESANDKAKNISRIIDTLKKYKETSSGSRAKEGAVMKDESSNKNILPDKPDSSENNLMLDQVKAEFQTQIPENEDFMSALPDATSTTDDEVQILNEQDHESHARIPQNENTQMVDIKSEPQLDVTPELNSFQNTPATPQWEVLLPQLQQPGPSTPLSTTQHPSKFELSHQMDNCIQQAYEKYHILERRTLDAFLTHVKKKSNPIRVASNYTNDVRGLKSQLKEILRLYYMTPETGTKADALFIKWLNGLVDRFDGPVSRKRKPSSKSFGGPSSKK